MFTYEWMVSKRYVFRKNSSRFISFVSIVGILLGVSSLIIILSVMNGFQKELKQRISGISAHLQILPEENAFLPQWQSIKHDADQLVNVRHTAPFVQKQGLIKSEIRVRSAVLRAVVPQEERKLLNLQKSEQSLDDSLQKMDHVPFGIILGSDLAHHLGVGVGNRVLVVVPRLTQDPLRSTPKTQIFHVVSLFHVGLYEYDNNLAYMRLRDAQKLYGTKNQISGLSISVQNDSLLDETEKQLTDMLTKRKVENYFISNWQKDHASLFEALTLEKRTMFVILALIIAVASFNIVSSLIMLVIEKRNDIAILRTMGATPFSIMAIFLWQGFFSATIGITMGTALGVLVAHNIDVIVPFLERQFHTHFLNKDIYFLSELPSDIHVSDVLTIVGTAWVLSLIATIYPSWRATQVDPADVLRD